MVKRVFELRDVKTDASRTMIRGYPEIARATQQRKAIRFMHVKRILDRRAVYKGRYKYSGIEAIGKHQRII